MRDMHPGYLPMAGAVVRLPYADRASAGALLADRLREHAGPETLVLGIPRGGVPVAAAIAELLGAELDVVVARKLGAPSYPEYAIGAITADGTRFLDEAACVRVGVTQRYLDAVSAREQAEARRREAAFRARRGAPRVRGRTVIVVDDGLATGATMVAAVDAVRRQRPSRVVVAVPVGTRDACRQLGALADDVVCLALPEPFIGVGACFRSFPQLEDDEVRRVLAEARSRLPAAAG